MISGHTNLIHSLNVLTRLEVCPLTDAQDRLETLGGRHMQSTGPRGCSGLIPIADDLSALPSRELTSGALAATLFC